MEKLNEKLRNARTYPGSLEKSGMMPVKILKKENETYYFYKDRDGKYYFETEGIRRIEREFEKKNKRKRW